MSRKKNKVAKFTLSQDAADRLIRTVKQTVEKEFNMPAAGDHNAEFHVRANNDSENFTIAVYQGEVNRQRHSMSARITHLGLPLLRLCVNGSTHTNPDGTKIGRTHWHVYREGEDDWNAFDANITSPSFVDDTILLLDKFNVIRKPHLQESLL
jgi:hypothetical protein